MRSARVVLVLVFQCVFLTNAAFAHPASGIVVEAQGRVYFIYTNHGVMRIEPSGKLTNIHEAKGGHWLAFDTGGAFSKVTPKQFERITPDGVVPSLSDADLSEIGFRWHVITQVIMLGTLARAAGCGGLVASGQETRELRRELGDDFAIVTPGVRPAGTAAGDQARVLTPKEAITTGATYLVVGRPILESANPAQSAAAIVSEIGEAAAG